MIDEVEEGDDWKNLEASMGTYNFEMIFNLFKEMESNDEIYEMCVQHFFVLLYYDISVLFTTWVLFTEITFEQQIVCKNFYEILSVQRPKIKKSQNGIELSLTQKDVSPNGNLSHVNSQTTLEGHPPKKQLLQILGRANSNYFFTFNYTRTLERIYGVSENDICHIHGVSQDSKNINNFASEDLIFGHGEESFGTNVTNIFTTAYNIAKKPVNQCIVNNELFFEKLGDMNSIYSYGFSFSDVDMPYVSKICNSIRDTSTVVWYLNDFNPNEHEILKRKIVASGFNGQFDTFHVD
jgi:hypothetical protein